MVYEWEPHKDTITRLYVQEQKQVDEIVEYMRVHHNFTPSKRAYQTQFRRWNLPSKHQPALKNDALVARAKQLWERNLTQAEMVATLNREGFAISSRELNRVRSAHRWLLRTKPDHAPPLDADLPLLLGVAAPDDHVAPDEELAAQLREVRRRKMEYESAERWASKRRRRRTRQYAGMPADPPGPPRFPSETTLAQSQVILALDKDLYAAIRDKFQAICEAEGIVKKTTAGSDVWHAAKQSLVDAFTHLQNVMWADDQDMDRKKLALEVICTDVTKRMRAAVDKPLLLADAKNVLGLNPEQSREVRSNFYNILKADGFTSKVALGAARWKELKQKWIDESEMLQRAFEADDAGISALKIKAVETLATDVMRRLRDDQSRRKGGRMAEGKPTAVVLDDDDDNDDDDDDDFCQDAPVMGDMENDPSGFATSMLVHSQGQHHSHHHHHTHPPRLLPDHLVDPQMAMQMPLDAELGPPLLLDPDAQDNFMEPHQQFMSAAAPSPFDATQPFQQQAAPPPPPPPSGPVAVYIQLGGNLDHVSPGQFWIALLSSQSIEELRQVAASKFPGSRCVQVQGLLRMQGMDGQIPLPVEDDHQLAAFLAQSMTPSFSVQLSYD